MLPKKKFLTLAAAAVRLRRPLANLTRTLIRSNILSWYLIRKSTSAKSFLEKKYFFAEKIISGGKIFFGRKNHFWAKNIFWPNLESSILIRLSLQK